ncbi:MAG: helix-hairpin-helix domain-containing protein [Candidatus Levybacteria bacterium]|nr:helix-hairpin-helix domain-containing protein [Candidatus Levybacteria bacterium]
MDQQEDVLPQFIRSNLLLIVAGVGGLIFLGYGLYQISQPKHEEILVQKASGDSAPAPTYADSGIKVDIEGAVLKPGVYDLSSDARVQDAIVAAGGLSAKVDKSELAKSLNLASRVSDGMKIYIPFHGESASGSNQSVMGSQTGMISVNTASQSQLESLPGIGGVTAQKIISNRPYASIDELVSKKSISSKTLDKIKNQISL